MKNRLTRILLLFTLILIASTCHKYPEGGWSNVAIKHLFGGNKDGSQKVWHLKLYEVDGIDSTFYLSPGNGSTNFTNEAVVFKITTARYKDYFIKTQVFEQGIKLSTHKKNIETINPGIMQCSTIQLKCERNIFSPESNTNFYSWKIIKLTTKELILSGFFQSSYKIILKS
jgi:hypothetical protein